jgi:hypothetical protein
MLRRVILVRTDDLEGFSAFIIRVTRIGEVGSTLAVTSNRHTQRGSIASYGYRWSYFTDSCHSDDGGTEFLRNIGS